MIRKIFQNKRNAILLLSFFLPVAILLSIYIAMGIAPFGEKSLLIMDLNGQTVDFFGYIRGILTGDNGFTYSFYKGIGGNVLGLLGYYGAFPLTFLLALFPADNMPEAVLFINCVLIALCGLSMCIFLQSHKKDWDFSVLLFSTAYALMSYTVVYSLELQWLYGVVLLPMVLLGVDRIIDGRRWGTFVVSYTLLLLSNIYTGYMVTLFSGIYFLWRIFSAPKMKDTGKKILCYALSGIGSFALSAVWTVPSYLATQAGREGARFFSPDTTLSYGLKNIFMKFFIGQYDSITNGYPESSGTISIFCGMAVLGLCVYYFMHKKISAREKICSAVVFVIFALSVVFLSLDKVWHVFSYPNWFPYRWVFIISFFMIFLAHRAWTEKEDKNSRMIYAFVGLLIVLCAVYALGADKLRDTSLAVLSIILLAVYTVLMYLRPKFSKIVSGILIACLCVELSLNGVAMMKGLDSQFGYKQRSDYDVVSVISDTVDEIKEIDDSPFYRIEKTDLRTDNDAMNAGYAGMTHYSSSFDIKFNNLNNSLGLLQESRACRYLGATPVIDSVFGVKYVLSRFTPADSASYTRVIKSDEYSVYRNDDALPLGFMIAGDGTAPAYTGNYLDNQNLFCRAITGDSAFTPIAAQSEDLKTYSFTVTAASPVYVSFSKKLGGERISVYRNGQRYDVRDASETKCKLLGTFRPGDMITVEFPDAMENTSFAYLNEDVISENAKKLTKTGLEITEFKDIRIKGVVNTQNSGKFMLTIPYDTGWSVYVDGEKVKTELLLNTFLGFDITSGEHEVELKYRAPGQTIGTLLSLAALAVLAVLIYRKKKKK